jgi:hypothetical protein
MERGEHVQIQSRAAFHGDQIMRRRLLLATPILATPALSQPRAAIRVLVGFAPGGAVDQSVRIAAEAIARRGGPLVIAETRSGALGFLAAGVVARAVPDGTVLASAIMGALRAALEEDTKTLLACSTIENVGLITLGLGLALAICLAPNIGLVLGLCLLLELFFANRGLDLGLEL